MEAVVFFFFSVGESGGNMELFEESGVGFPASRLFRLLKPKAAIHQRF
jgi:hypothetical protein